MTVFVISEKGERLMPTTRLGKVKRMLKSGKAVIYKRRPFTIKLTYETTTYTQPMELCLDTGYQEVGLSVKSQTKEYVSAQYDLLKGEKDNHDAQRKYRKSRRNRRRHRAPRFDNRRASKKKGWLAPSIKNKADRHVDLVERYCSAAPITDVYPEMGQFDIQVLQAVQEGKPIPEGVDYQQGPTYGIDTLREAVFQRDNYTCIFCGRSALTDKAILYVHHCFFWRGQHGNRLDELGTACERCHTHANHQKGGKLWGYDKEMQVFSGAAFMNSVRWDIYNRLKELPGVQVHMTYGAATKRSRLDLGLEKSHVNDAYAMGNFHPEIRAEFEHYEKRRRNNRVLEKFYDAKYIDVRDGQKKSGADLSCGRTKRNIPRNNPGNLRIYRGKKMSKGRRAIRKKRYPIRPGDVLVWKNKKQATKGCQHEGKLVVFETGASSVSRVKLIYHTGGWAKALPKKKKEDGNSPPSNSKN